MIIVTGSVTGTEDTIEEMLKISLAHVRRSRNEPGCVSHDVARRAEAPMTLTFLERWADMPALLAHFAVPESGSFIRRLAELSPGPQTLELWDAAPIAVPST